MIGGEHSVSRRNMLRTVGTGLAVGSIGSVSGCLGLADDNGSGSEITPEEAMGDVENPDEEPSSDSVLAGSATGEPSGIERHNMRFIGRYEAYRFGTRGQDWLHIYNGGQYVIRIEVWPAGSSVDHGEPDLINEQEFGRWNAFKGYGDIRISVVDRNASLVINPNVRNVEIWMSRYRVLHDFAEYWVGEF